jgi:branched-subunit amino acid aminotransferase/4-amino-4-deoxychorismate lyase
MTVGCYTCTRAAGGRPWHPDRHVRRLARDAALLGLGAIDEARAFALLDALAAPTRDGPDRKLRLDAQPSRDGAPRLVASFTPLDADPATWRAIMAPAPHPGRTALSTAKTTERAHYEAAFAAATAAGADEALLCDAAGFLVEGARTNLFVALADGRVVTPPVARGGQAGVAREILLDAIESLVEADVAGAALASAREIVAVNAVRGARSIASLDGRPIGAGEPGPWSERLDRALRERPR